MANSKVVNDPIDNKTCVIVGTRPGIIKMSPLIEELQHRDVESLTIHAGQHYSETMDEQIFEDLQLPPPDEHLTDVKNKEFHGEQTAAMLAGIEEILLEERPENVLVCGDANYNLAGALAARKLRLNLGHVESGLRSDDWRMPEEHNRVMIDHISDFLFAPTETARQNAIEDNVKGEIFVTGNTIVDAVQRNLQIAAKSSTVLQELGLTETNYAVLTAHREENVDDEEVLVNLVDIIGRTVERIGVDVIYPIHPRTRKRLQQFGFERRIEGIEGLEVIEPLGYLDFLKLLDNADFVQTDSGGIQEEACILGIPCITLRENTERPETVEVGANRVAGTDPDSVLEATETVMNSEGTWQNPFGNGDAAEQIIDVVVTG